LGTPLGNIMKEPIGNLRNIIENKLRT